MRRKTILTILFVTIITLSITTFTYAFFLGGVNNANQQTATVTAGTLKLTFADNDNGIAKALKIGESVTKKFVIENTGSLDAEAIIEWKDLISTYTKGSLTYTLEYSLTEEGPYTTLIENANVPTSNGEKINANLTDKIIIPQGVKFYANLIITLQNLEHVDQTEDYNASFTTRFNIKTALNESEITYQILANKYTKTGVFATQYPFDEIFIESEDDYGKSYVFDFSKVFSENKYFIINPGSITLGNLNGISGESKCQYVIEYYTCPGECETDCTEVCSDIVEWSEIYMTDLTYEDCDIACMDTSEGSCQCESVGLNDNDEEIYNAVIYYSEGGECTETCNETCEDEITDLTFEECEEICSGPCEFSYDEYEIESFDEYCEENGGSTIIEKLEEERSLAGQIIRINGDGSLKVLLVNEYSASLWGQYSSFVSYISQYLYNVQYNINSDDNAYVGFKYGFSNALNYDLAHKNLNISEVQKNLNTYYEHLIAEIPEIKQILSDTSFCNDRSLSSQNDILQQGYSKQNTLYNSVYRMQSNSPSLKCPSKNDTFTVYDGANGNTELIYPIGLLSGDEVYISNILNINFGYDLPFWTMTPLGYNFMQTNKAEIVTFGNGSFNATPANDYGIILPVINIAPEYARQLTLLEGFVWQPSYLT